MLVEVCGGKRKQLKCSQKSVRQIRAMSQYATAVGVGVVASQVSDVSLTQRIRTQARRYAR